MDMPMSGDSDNSSDSSNSVMGPLSAVGINLNNVTEASDYLDEILDDSILQFDGIKYSKFFWYGIVVAIGLAAAFNAYQWTVASARKRSAAKERPYPTRPSNPLGRLVSVIVLTLRALSYAQVSPSRYPLLFRLPPFGIIFMLLAYLGFVLALQFIHVSIPGDAHWEAIGIRAGWLSIGQIPLLILLAGKYNIVGFLTGVGYERLNVFHRWVARVLLLTATLHFGYQSYGWNRLGLWRLEWDTDTCAPTGMASYALLIWMNVSTLAPFRNLFYEFFVIQHLLTFLGFIIAIMYHLPIETAPSVRTYIWITVGFYLADRLIRSLFYAYNNVRPSRATLTCFPNDITKILVKNPDIRKWSPGAFVLLSIPQFGVGQSHPATIASTPTSHGGDLVFILRAHGGFTKRLAAHAKSDALSQANLGICDRKKESAESQRTGKATYLALIDGPYSGVGADFTAFDSAVLIAASTGITFTLSILLDLAHRASNRPGQLPLRKLAFIWIIKNSTCQEWVSSELSNSIDALHNAGVEAIAQIFVTCDCVAENSTPDLKRCTCETSDISEHGCCCSTTPTPLGDESRRFELCARKASTQSVAGEKHDIAVVQDGKGCDSPHSSKRFAGGVSLHSGRPDTRIILSDVLSRAEGEMGVAVCGPLDLSQRVRRDVAVLNAKGLGGPGVYLHAENFGW